MNLGQPLNIVLGGINSSYVERNISRRIYDKLVASVTDIRLAVQEILLDIENEIRQAA